MLVAAASLALRGADPQTGTLIVWEPVGGPRFPNGAVAGTGGSTDVGPLRARRWWDPTCPTGGLDPTVVHRFITGLDPLTLPNRPEDGIGWGPGKTPAGDDVVVGMLIGLRAAGRTDLADQLAAACAGGDTTPFSRALLDHAAAGRAAGPVLTVIRALGGRAPLPVAVATLDRFGASSGRHLLDGIRRALVEVDFSSCGHRVHNCGNQSAETHAAGGVAA